MFIFSVSKLRQRVCYGLFYDNELVVVMTFGKPRFRKLAGKRLSKNMGLRFDGFCRWHRVMKIGITCF